MKVIGIGLLVIAAVILACSVQVVLVYFVWNFAAHHITILPALSWHAAFALTLLLWVVGGFFKGSSK